MGKEKDEVLKVALTTLEKIYEGCGYVIEDELHEEAVGLAKLVRKDCCKPIQLIKEVVMEANTAS